MATLVLNADGAPVSLLPVSIIEWREAIKILVLDRCHVVSWHEDWIVRSARWETMVPSVIMLKEYQKPKQHVRFTKSNVFLRDLHTCAYCDVKLEKRFCTIDHVLPLSLGGKTNWENSVTACGSCNSAKGSNYKIKPKFKPHEPNYFELINKRKQLPFAVKDPAWLEYLQ